MVTPQTILLPTDFTGRCDRSRDRAVLLARVWDARLVLLHVLEDDPTIPWDREEAMDRAQAKLESEVQDDDIAICTRVAFGDVTSTILDVAAEFSADLIVTGISRKDELGDFLIGTTVERLGRRAGLPLLIVKGRAEAEYRQLMAATDFRNAREPRLQPPLTCSRRRQSRSCTRIMFGSKHCAVARVPLRRNRRISHMSWTRSSARPPVSCDASTPRCQRGLW